MKSFNDRLIWHQWTNLPPTCAPTAPPTAAPPITLAAVFTTPPTRPAPAPRRAPTPASNNPGSCLSCLVGLEKALVPESQKRFKYVSYYQKSFHKKLVQTFFRSVPNLWATFLNIVDNFVILHSICVFSLSSLVNEDNFHSQFTEMTKS